MNARKRSEEPMQGGHTDRHDDRRVGEAPEILHDLVSVEHSHPESFLEMGAACIAPESAPHHHSPPEASSAIGSPTEMAQATSAGERRTLEVAERTPARMIRVTIVDDHSILREGVKLILEADPEIEVVGQASNGLDAVRLVTELTPDVCLMDIQMPGVDGIEATERIRRQSPATRVLVLSQIDNEAYFVRVLQVGAMGYVLKQNASDELVAAVHTVNNGHVYMTPSMASRFVQMYFRREEEKKDRSKLLTPREIDVLKGIADGLTNRQIADELSVSIKTVQTHRGNIMEKLDLHDRVELVKYALRAGLVQLNASSGP